MFQVDEKGGGGPPDILSQPAMHNAYFICHNVQVLIDTFFSRLFPRRLWLACCRNFLDGLHISQ